jgi:hypothetical protein
VRVRITDIRDHSTRELDLRSDACDMPGWQSGVVGWSIGSRGSGAQIEFDETLNGCRIGVFRANFQILLWGSATTLPNVWLFPMGVPTNRLVPIEPERWLLVEREDLSRVAMGGNVRLRIDQSPIRFGNYILECLKTNETTEGCCAFCNEPMKMYFRVGSQQACPACTEKFKQETRASLDRYYRRALRDGILVAVAGGAIHGILLHAANVSFGSIFIGILVGIAMRIASRESAGKRYQWTAVLLTFAAGSLPWWLGRGTTMAAIYLAFGMLAAWTVTARNVPTTIHGPRELIPPSLDFPR